MATDTSGILDSSYQEAFARNIAIDGMNQTDAYKAAGYSYQNMQPTTIHEAASRLAADGKVLARIRALQQASTAAIVAERVWTQERLLLEAETNLHLARRLEQVAPANGALKLIAEATGLLVPQEAPSVTITKVTVVLNHGEAEPRVIEGTITAERPREQAPGN